LSLKSWSWLFLILDSWKLETSLESFSWFLNCSWLNLEIILLGFLSSSLLSSNWNLKLLLNLSLNSWIVLDSILKSFSWAFCHHLCYHHNTLNQSWFIIIKQWSLLLHPMLKGANYDYWKERMIVFFESTHIDMWNVVEKGNHIPLGA